MFLFILIDSLLFYYVLKNKWKIEWYCYNIVYVIDYLVCKFFDNECFLNDS